MKVETLQKLAADGGYYLIRYKGYQYGYINSRSIPVILKRNKIHKQFLAECSYLRVGFMEYISNKAGYIDTAKISG
jgi:hypothetical protein